MFVGRSAPTGLSQAQEDEWGKGGIRGSVIVHEDLTDEDEDEDEDEEEGESGSVIVKNDPDSEDEQRKERKNEEAESESEVEEDKWRGSVIVHEDDEETTAVWKEPGWRGSSEIKTHVADDSEDEEEGHGSVIVRDDPDEDDDEDGDEGSVQAKSYVRSSSSDDAAERNEKASAPVKERSTERKGDTENASAQKAQPRKLKKQVWMKQQKKKRTVKSVLLEEEDFLWKTLDRFEVEKKEVESRRRLRNERRQGVLWLTAPIPELSEPTTTPTVVPSSHTLPINSLKSERTRLVPRPPSPPDEPRYASLIVMEFPERVRPKSRPIPDSEPSRPEAEDASFPSLPAAVRSSPSIASSPLSVLASSPHPHTDLSPRPSATSPCLSPEGIPRSEPRSRQNSSPQLPIASLFPLLPPINLPFN